MSTMNSTSVAQEGQAGPQPVLNAELAAGWERAVVGVYLTAVAVALMYLMVQLWPEADSTEGWTKQVSVFWLATPARVSDDMRLLLLVIITGGLGSFIHAATSFVDYVGNRKFIRSWILWYLLRPLIGSVLALVLYVAMRGGLLSATAGSSDVSPFGVTAVAFLAGMFSKQATDKLSELFSTLFKTSDAGDAARSDKLDSTAPKVASVEPSQLPMGTAIDLVVKGSGFESTSIVRLNGDPKPTQFVSASQLTVKIEASDVEKPSTLSLTVHNAAGESSTPVSLTVAP
jgi:hypothetical protein